MPSEVTTVSWLPSTKSRISDCFCVACAKTSVEEISMSSTVITILCLRIIASFDSFMAKIESKS